MSVELSKAPTGVLGLDELTKGGLPERMVTVIVGGPGTGKTMLGSAIVANGAEAGEAGVIVSLEQGKEGLERTLETAGIDLVGLREAGKLVTIGVKPEHLQATPTGQYSLDGLVVRVRAAIESVGAKRLLVDTADALLMTTPYDPGARFAFEAFMAELRDLGLTTIITAQDPEDSVIGGRLVEYLADCVIQVTLDQHDRHTSRSIRVVKYRGSSHVGDAVAFHIDEDGPAAMPMAFVKLADVQVDDSTISSGLPALDVMLGGRGYYRRSTVMITGEAGTGKTSLGAYFAVAAAQAGERALFVSFEEPATQLRRNLASIGIDISGVLDSGHLRIESVRAEERSLEGHLRRFVRWIDECEPVAVVLDPVSALSSLAPSFDVSGVLTRLVDLLHSRGATGLFTALTPGGLDQPGTLSSLVDTWLHVRNIESSGERNRALFVNKSRGMPHTNQVREFVMTAEGVQLLDIVVAGEQVVTGSARIAELERVAAAERERLRDRSALQTAVEQGAAATEAQIAALRAEYERERVALEARIATLTSESERRASVERAVRVARGSESTSAEPTSDRDEAGS